MDEETRAAFDEMRRRFDGIDQRFDGVDQRFDGVDQRLGAGEQRVDSLEQRVLREIRQVGVLTEQLRADLQLVAEGVIGNAQALERLRGEMHERFRENEIIVGGAFRAIRRDIEDLRDAR